MGKNIIMLTDYRGFFYSAYKYGHYDSSTDTKLMKKYFADEGYDLKIKKFKDINFRSENYRNQYIIYHSAEDRDLLYKSYIEDILLGLEIQGAILIPNFYYFKAHHNKVFMEILRDLDSNEKIKNLIVNKYGSFEDYNDDLNSGSSELIIKPAGGCASKQVKLMRTQKAKRRLGKRISRSLHMIDFAKDIVKAYVRTGYSRISHHRKKFITQEFIPNLPCDYRVQIYDDKYYVMLRKTRKHDFRASGSGDSKWIRELPAGLLNYAESVFHSFSAPYISLDIGFDENEFYLFEFQFLNFGTKIINKSTFHFVKNNNSWEIQEGTSILEKEIVRSIISFIERNPHV